MKIFGKTVLAASLCALLAAPAALATEKGGLAYIGHCEGFTIQSSDSKGNVDCTIDYEKKDKILGMGCYREFDGKTVLKDLNFFHYKKQWEKDFPKPCK